MHLDAYIVDGLRTPIGRHAGALSAVRPDDLLAGVIREVVARSAFSPDQIEDVIAGNTNQAGEDCRNVARNASLLAGLPTSVGGQTVNRLCGSGLAALIDASRAVSTGAGDVIVAGGVESMSRAPFVLAKANAAFDRTASIFDTTIGTRFPNPKLVQSHGGDTMPETADNVASDIGISREEADAFALASQQKYEAARARGFFDREMAPVSVAGRKGALTTVSADEHPRPETTFATLSGLRSINNGGVTTAGNASGINDGAGALIVANGVAVERSGARPLARVVSAAIAGVEPRVMGLGPVPASRKALERAGLTLKDIDLIELNEAFASQVLGCLRQLGVADDDARVNPNGGAIAIGHPLGASGIRLALTAARQLQETGGRYALVTMCIGIGQGIAVVLERV
ncbi:3-oxoadipyl-CoA thiolase [Chelatococcus asaccharovorans]|uniref:acetyl-CoA C-acyltransferase n=1 Tax=Chelatococcus asaccharovorans TaxID=28210 RepID=A0A2V3TVW4_9HYPH|nr:3-oxoadipyl-CoA thiolase [Chelatococcus asaccharovorans]MBS7705172.1 3-oxoadipyl-CoA thiolase [Chelatococcus asaccharovorans]PXW53669.1 acetyl-CoA C-acetyltransferase [Chelatococcus asaccharovorans]